MEALPRQIPGRYHASSSVFSFEEIELASNQRQHRDQAQLEDLESNASLGRKSVGQLTLPDFLKADEYSEFSPMTSLERQTPASSDLATASSERSWYLALLHKCFIYSFIGLGLLLLLATLLSFTVFLVLTFTIRNKIYRMLLPLIHALHRNVGICSVLCLVMTAIPMIPGVELVALAAAQTWGTWKGFSYCWLGISLGLIINLTFTGRVLGFFIWFNGCSVGSFELPKYPQQEGQNQDQACTSRIKYHMASMILAPLSIISPQHLAIIYSGTGLSIWWALLSTLFSCFKFMAISYWGHLLNKSDSELSQQQISVKYGLLAMVGFCSVMYLMVYFPGCVKFLLVKFKARLCESSLLMYIQSLQIPPKKL